MHLPLNLPWRVLRAGSGSSRQLSTLCVSGLDSHTAHLGRANLKGKRLRSWKPPRATPGAQEDRLVERWFRHRSPWRTQGELSQPGPGMGFPPAAPSKKQSGPPVRDGENPGPGLGAPARVMVGVGWGPGESPRGRRGKDRDSPTSVVSDRDSAQPPLPPGKEARDSSGD